MRDLNNFFTQQDLFDACGEDSIEAVNHLNYVLKMYLEGELKKRISEGYKLIQDLEEQETKKP